jgi:hypothetical protein
MRIVIDPKVVRNASASVLWRRTAIVNVKYPPAPAKKTEVPAFVPDTRSVEEKLRDAKRSVRSGL